MPGRRVRPRRSRSCPRRSRLPRPPSAPSPRAGGRPGCGWLAPDRRATARCGRRPRRPCTSFARVGRRRRRRSRAHGRAWRSSRTAPA
ncbi:MAG: hypothetical protein EOP08_02910 [Proteobacteria bacterium]|nr:MAG: hypothetical protein EOP08_02910 [Pseudomonadota bacterium]